MCLVVWKLLYKILYLLELTNKVLQRRKTKWTSYSIVFFKRTIFSLISLMSTKKANDISFTNKQTRKRASFDNEGMFHVMNDVCWRCLCSAIRIIPWHENLFSAVSKFLKCLRMKCGLHHALYKRQRLFRVLK